MFRQRELTQIIKDFQLIQARDPKPNRDYCEFKRLGEGQYGQVWMALNKNDNEPYAIKVVIMNEMEEEIRQYMRSEIKFLQNCQHLNIIKLFDFFEIGNRLYLILEYLQMNMQECVKYFQGTKMSHALVIQFLRQFTSGLGQLHKDGIIHRDIKLENIMIKLSNEDQQAFEKNQQTIENIFPRVTIKIIDLGLCRQLSNNQLTKTFVGTFTTMAPEILEQKAYGLQSDIYSLGVVLYQLIMGKLPYRPILMNLQDQIDKIKGEDAPFNDEVLPTMKELIKGMMRYDPEERTTFDQLYQHKYLKCDQLRSQNDISLLKNQQIYTGKENKYKIRIYKNQSIVQQQDIQQEYIQTEKKRVFPIRIITTDQIIKPDIQNIKVDVLVKEEEFLSIIQQIPTIIQKDEYKSIVCLNVKKEDQFDSNYEEDFKIFNIKRNKYTRVFEAQRSIEKLRQVQTVNETLINEWSDFLYKIGDDLLKNSNGYIPNNACLDIFNQDQKLYLASQNSDSKSFFNKIKGTFKDYFFRTGMTEETFQNGIKSCILQLIHYDADLQDTQTNEGILLIRIAIIQLVKTFQLFNQKFLYPQDQTIEDIVINEAENNPDSLLQIISDMYQFYKFSTE